MSQPDFKGILLAGGEGSRLYPLTRCLSKQLQGVYNKPLIYYALATLMEVGIRDFLLISTPRDLPLFQALFGNGALLGIHISYAPQAQAQGIAQAFLIAESFIEKQPLCLILGDNLFYGVSPLLRTALKTFREGSASIFSTTVPHPSAYGVIEWGEAGRIQSLEEKPQIPRSSDIVTGLYLYDSEVVSYAKQLKPSSRGELEITDINRKYLAQQQLQVFPLSQEMRWFDVGTPDSLLEASLFIASQEKLQGRKIACLEEIALRQKFLKEERATQALLKSLPEGSWKQYVQEVWNHLEQEGRL